MSDLISRQDAIDAICENCSMAKAGERCTDDFCRDVRNLKEVPSAEPERKNGKWKRKAEWLWQGYECSNCKYAVDSRTNFCPICGADMRGEKDERLNQQTRCN